jgi:hypothetical protein
VSEGRHGVGLFVFCAICDSKIVSDAIKRLQVYLVKNNWRIPTNASCSDIPQMSLPRSRRDSVSSTYLSPACVQRLRTRTHTKPKKNLTNHGRHRRRPTGPSPGDAATILHPVRGRRPNS